jgi:hypothetical protein
MLQQITPSPQATKVGDLSVIDSMQEGGMDLVAMGWLGDEMFFCEGTPMARLGWLD